MFRSVQIKQFKSLRSLEIDLGRVNVFIGANGAGKSNLLEALGVLGAAAFGRVDDETLLRRGVRPGVPRLYKAAFPQTQQENVQHILFAATAEDGSFYRTTLWNPIENPSPAWKFKTETLSRGGEKDPVLSRSTTSVRKHNQEQGLAALQTVNLQPGDQALALLDELRSYAIYAPNTSGLRGLIQDSQTREPVGLTGGRLPEAIEELVNEERTNSVLRDAMDEVRDLLDWATDFKAASALRVPLSPSAARSRLVVQFVDRYMAKGRNSLTGYDASEGALFILFMAVLILHPKSPSVLSIDNFDQALNPRLAARMIEAICRWTTSGGRQQLLLTAHNPAVLDGIPLQQDEVRLFAVQRNSLGHTEITRIDLQRALHQRGGTEKSLSQMWMTGLLGAVPNV